jgi:dTDP-4-dehydrorhamnose reductase
MRPKILLTGGTGQVGHELLRFLPQIGEVVAPGRQDLDLTQPDRIRSIVREIRPNLIVNAAAYTAVDDAETERSACHAANAVAPAVLAEEAKKAGAAIVHYSTDYIFDGEATAPYDELAPACPVNFYGQTKLEGERAIQSSGVPHLILRVAWVYGTRRHNFLLTVLRLAVQRDQLRIVRDQIGAPTSSREIARATARVLAENSQPSGSGEVILRISGTFNLTAGGETNRCAFAQAIVEESRGCRPQPAWLQAVTQNQPLLARLIVPISSGEYPTAARRPARSLLSNTRFENEFGFCLPDWRAQLHSVFAEDR